MTQNRSTAVMARRHEPHDSLDFFPTPPWATRALVEHVLTGGGWRADQLAQMTAWDPCCGAMHMVRPLKEYFAHVHASDIFDYGFQARQADFLMPGSEPKGPVDFLIFNPPFRLALPFILKAREIARQAVCVLVRTSFAEGRERYLTLFKKHVPLAEAQFVERVVMVKGRCVDPSKKYWNVEKQAWQKMTTATAYMWLVFPGRNGRDMSRAVMGCRKVWIPPARRQLERPGDYDDPAASGPAISAAYVHAEEVLV